MVNKKYNRKKTAKNSERGSLKYCSKALSTRACLKVFKGGEVFDVAYDVAVGRVVPRGVHGMFLCVTIV